MTDHIFKKLGVYNGSENSKNIEQIKNSKNIPSLPQILLQLVEACNDDTVPIEALAKIISKEPVLSVKVLRLINSPFIRLGDRVTTIDQAVLYLGADTIKNLAISASILQVFKKKREKDLFNYKYFWFHSFLCGLVAKELARRLVYFDPEEAFLAGLLHDIGKLVLLDFAQKKQYDTDSNGALFSGFPSKFEIKIGLSHNEAGACLIRTWKLTSLMADAVYYHHEDLASIEEAFPLVKIIHVANLLSHELDEDIRLEGVQAADTLFDLKIEDIDDILNKARIETAEVASAFEIDVAEFSSEAPPLRVVRPAEDETPQEKLTSELVDMTLMYGTIQNLLSANSKTAILKTVENGLKINFEIESVIFFIHDKNKNILIGYISEDDQRFNMISGLVVKPTNNNLVSFVFNKKEMADSFWLDASKSLTIFDRQMIGILQQDGMIGIPMIARKEIVGVIVIGASKNQSAVLAEDVKRLNLFSSQAALCLQHEFEKEIQLENIKNERMEASVSVANKVIHEVSNPLGIIKNYLGVLALKLPEKHPAQEELRIISEEVDRVKLLMLNLSSFSNPAKEEKALVNINVILSRFLKMVNTSILIPARIALHVSYDDKIPKILTSKNLIKQIVLNLVRNSVEVLKDGGNIYISTRCLNAAEKRLDESSKQPIEHVEIIIRDDGPGLPEEIKNRLFEPFQTTKKGRHSGLGLSIVHNCIKEINGKIRCQSTNGKGTEFSIILPVLF